MVEIYANIGWYGGDDTETMLETRVNGFIGTFSEVMVDGTLEALKLENNGQPFNYVIFTDGVILTKGVK